MWPVLFEIGNISVTWWKLAVLFMFLVLSFLWWRTMRIDCDEEGILAGVVGLFTTLVAEQFLAAKIVGVNMGLGLLWTLGFWYWWAVKNKWDFWEWLDVIVPTGMLAGAVINLGVGPMRFKYVLGYIIAGWLSRIVAKNYRKMKWYLSGKIGAGGLAGLLVWSLFEMIVEIWQTNSIYWGGITVSQWTAVVIFTVSLVLVYLRSGRKITKDLTLRRKK